MSYRYPALILVLLTILITTSSGAIMNKTFAATDTVIVNQTFIISDSPATPFLIWAASGYIGLILLILSFFSYPENEEGLVSILAWFPIAFFMYTSDSVDIVNGAGFTGQAGTYVLMENHTIYSFAAIQAIAFIGLVFAIGNTYRIWANQKRLQQLARPDGVPERQIEE